MAVLGRGQPTNVVLIRNIQEPAAGASASANAQVASVTVTASNASATGTANAAAAVASVTVTATNPTTNLTASVTPTTATVTVTATNPGVAAGHWPTTVDAGGRFIKDEAGNPYMIHGDAGWEAAVNLSQANMDVYLVDRAGRNVNLVEINMIEHKFTLNALDTKNVNGDLPFTGTAFQTSLNEAYWVQVDHFVAKAASLGVTVLANPAYLGFAHGNEGWSAEIEAASNAQMQAYGATLGARYARWPNIVWLIGVDDTPTATDLDRYDHMMTGIQGASDTHLVVAQNGRGTDGATSYGAYSWLKLNSVYTSDPNTVANAATAYGESTVRPTFLIEGKYQNFSGITLAQVRREQWQTILVGGLGGHLVGNEDVWTFGATGFGDSTDWAAHLADQSSVDHSYITQLFSVTLGGSVWKQLAPDLTDTYLTAGEGATTHQCAASFYVDYGVVYVPDSNAGSYTIDLTEHAGSHPAMRARWYDPTAGTFTPIGSFSTASSHTFAHPGNNSKSDTDWVLVVDASGDNTATAVGATVTVTATNPTLTDLSNANPTTAVVTATTNQPTFFISTQAAAINALVAVSATNPFVSNGSFVAPTALIPIAHALNQLAGTTGLDAPGAANVWAGTVGLDLIGALNHKNGTTQLHYNAVVKALATTYGGHPEMEAEVALSGSHDGGNIADALFGVQGVDLLGGGGKIPISVLGRPQPLQTASKPKWSTKKKAVVASATVGGAGIVATVTQLLTGILL